MLETLALMGHGFVNAMSLSNLLFMAGGTAIGIIIGCLPGLSAAMGVALLLPMTFTIYLKWTVSFCMRVHFINKKFII